MQTSTIGQRLKFLREEVLKLNMSQLARKLGVTAAAISKIEKDVQSDVSAKMAHLLGEMVEPYGYDAKWLIGGGLYKGGAEEDPYRWQHPGRTRQNLV